MEEVVVTPCDHPRGNLSITAAYNALSDADKARFDTDDAQFHGACMQYYFDSSE